jgi:hypothetical protein
MADTIKYLSDNPVRFTVVVVGVGQSVQELFGSHPSIQRCCEQIRMPRMSPPELRQIVDKRMPQLSMQMSPEVITQMIKFAQGLPGYMHLLGQLATRNAITRRSQQVEVPDLDAAVSKALERKRTNRLGTLITKQSKVRSLTTAIARCFSLVRWQRKMSWANSPPRRSANLIL